jgi:outer membrane protein assembly factor BamB
MNCRFQVALRSLLAVAPLVLLGADWPQFRGPGSLGVGLAKNLPTTWSDNSNIAWRTALPGFGASSPILWKDAIYVTGYSGYGLNKKEPGEQANLRLHLSQLKRSNGEIQWTQTLDARTPVEDYSGFIALHGYASGTPAVDASGVYVYFGRTGAAAYSHDGKRRWGRVLGDKTHGFGTAASPVLFGDLVIINAYVECGDMVALRKDTGDEVWRAKGLVQAWNTPVLVDVQGNKELVLNSQRNLQGFDPRSGKLLWTCQGMDDYICPTAVSHEGIVYAIGARKGTAIAVRAGGRGDVTETHRLWVIERGSNVSSPVFHQGHLYWANESRGIVYCADAATGEIKYEERLKPKPEFIYASPLVADGKLFYVSRQDGAFVLNAAPEFKLLAHNVLTPQDKSVFNASPVPDGNKLLLRSDKFLYAIGEK